MNKIEFPSYLSYHHFAESVRKHWRYATDPQQIAFLKTLLATSVSHEEVIQSGTKLWRAQLGHDYYPSNEPGEEQPAPFRAERMKPLGDRAREGRANPKGIPYLYLATHQETAMAEVRPTVGSEVSVGRFELKRNVRVLNCVTGDHRIMAYSGEPEPDERERAVWQAIDHAFSQPVTLGDDTADYAPTQIIAEFLRANGLDGVAYGSSFGPGHNVALFDLNVASLIYCELNEIRGVKLDWSPVTNPYTV